MLISRELIAYFPNKYTVKPKICKIPDRHNFLLIIYNIILQISLLYQTFEKCRQNQMKTTKEFCNANQTSESVSIVHHLFHVFMDSSDCKHFYINSIQNNNYIYFKQILFSLFLSFLLLIL